MKKLFVQVFTFLEIIGLKKLTVFVFMSLATVNTVYGQWTKKANELTKRAEANNVLYNNKLYVFGGFGDNPKIEKTNEVYDILANKWSEIAPIPPGKEISHQGTVLVDDNIWLIGGRSVDAYGPVSSQVLIYNIPANSWTNGPELIDPSTGKPFPIGAGGYVLVGRTLHVFGGFGPTICEDQAKLHLTINVDKYMADPAHVTWENKLAPLPIPRNHISYVTIGAKIYAFGGQFKHDCVANDQVYCHVYDIATDTWSRLTDLPKPRSHAEGATFAVDGRMFLVGGQGYNNLTQNTTYQFNPKDNGGLGSWTALSAYTLPGSYLGLSAKLAGKSFIITNGALNSYGNERVETYTAVVNRSAARTLGFSLPCLSQNVTAGENKSISNLLYCIEDSTGFTLSADAEWLNITNNHSGTVGLNGKDIEVNINTAGLSPGTYIGKITATGPLTASKASFCVNLTVAPSASGGYSLNVSESGTGSVVKSPNQQTYAPNTRVNLTAVPQPGWVFEGWTGDTVVTTNPLILAMDTNKYLTAKFIQDTVQKAFITNIVAKTGRRYELDTLRQGITYYTDREYTITTIPSTLTNAAIIKAPNDDKVNTSTAVLSFKLSAPAIIYVAYDPRGTVLPAWLASWKRLTDKVGVDDPKISSFNLYSKNYPAGDVSLGGNFASPAKGALCQYVVLAKPDLSANVTAVKNSFNNLNSTAIIADTITLNPVLGNDKFILYPNPLRNHFSVILPANYEGLSVMQIVSMNGKSTYIPKSLIKSFKEKVDVDIASLALTKGLYAVLMVSTNGKTNVIRMMIK
ncbi:kelch repeat-containing protein [Mucilaginibacter sp.]|uniref:Kelch repeat-containing protein n=1 Tax=Mucilaginibacter sp. TaxID=1882438 RepID=UPI0025E286F2|nr:kelch repeat-containing protein [Mucilaginibacter sp.]